MNQRLPSLPVLGTAFYSTSLFLLTTFGSLLQVTMGLTGVVLLQVVFFLGLSVAFAAFIDPMVFDQPLANRLRLKRLSLSGVVKSVFLGVLALALAQVLTFLMLFLVQALGGEMVQPYQRLLESPFLVALFVGGVLPAICEEMAFRGYLQGALQPLGPRAAVLLTGLLFGAMHLSLVRLIPLTVLGVVFSVAVQRTGSLYSSMIMHFVNNATALGLTYLFRNIPVPETAAAPTAGSIIFLAGATVALSAAVWMVARSMGPGDLTRPAEESSAQERRPIPAARWLLTAVPLVPGLLIVAYAMTLELKTVFQ